MHEKPQNQFQLYTFHGLFNSIRVLVMLASVKHLGRFVKITPERTNGHGICQLINNYFEYKSTRNSSVNI